MEREFVPYELAVRVKDLGFDEPCIASYGYNMQEGYPKEMRERLVLISEISLTEGRSVSPEDLRNSALEEDISAPMYSQVFRWLREKWELDHEISYGGKSGEYSAFVGDYIYWGEYFGRKGPARFTYDGAQKACLERLCDEVEKRAKEGGPKIAF